MRRKLITKVCQYCEEDFQIKSVKQIFCNRECYKSSKEITHVKTCELCKQEFVVAYDGASQRFCSNACKGRWLSVVLKKDEKVVHIKSCEYCKQEFRANDANQLYCSKECIKIANAPKIPILVGKEKSLFIYKCHQCNKEFRHRKENKIFCSTECWLASRDRSITKQCEYCHNEFTVAYRFRKQKYCNQKCMGNGRAKSTPKNITVCKYCNEEFEQPANKKYQKQFCSRQCMDTSLRNGSSEYIVKICKNKNCNKQFTVHYLNKDKMCCSRSCATAGEMNAMYGKYGKESSFYGETPWNKGLTAKTDERLAKAGEKISVIIADKIVNNQFNHPIGFIAGWYRSEKNDCEYYYRSSYELKAYKKLEENDNVISYKASPLRIRYMFENRKHNYIPDILVTYNDSHKELIEIKPMSILKRKDEQLMLKLEALRLYCFKNDMIAVVWTEKDINS